MSYKHSPEARQKISASKRGKPRQDLLGNTFGIGYRHTQEAKERIAAALRARPKVVRSYECPDCGVVRVVDRHKHFRITHGKSTARCKDCVRVAAIERIVARCKGKRSPNRMTRPDVICAHCNRQFTAKHPTKIARFCSWSCNARHNLVGKNHWNWQGGITNVGQTIRKTEPYNDWRKQIYRRDDYTCQACGIRGGGSLDAHHIEPFASVPAKRLDQDNGITLCKNCHREIHMFSRMT